MIRRIKPKHINKLENLFSESSIALLLPFKMIHFLSYFVTRLSYFEKNYFKNKVLALKEFLYSKDLNYNKRTIHSCLYSNLFKQLKLKKIAHFNQKQAVRNSELMGVENLENARKSGKGIILLNSHWGYSPVITYIMYHYGYKNIYTIVGNKGSQSKKFKNEKSKSINKFIVFKAKSDTDTFKAIIKAKEVLNDGGFFHILGDAGKGNSTVTVDFLGRKMGFRKSFAELALNTNAFVLPVFSYINSNGKIIVDILPALDIGSDNMQKEERIAYLVQQYSKVLADKWTKYPHQINKLFIKRYLNIPIFGHVNN